MSQLKRVCFLLQVKPERLEEYKARHKEVWPRMLDALSETGWSNYSLFLRQDGLLVGYLETEDFAQCLKGMAEREVNQQWQAEMQGFFVDAGNRPADQQMMTLEEVFHLE